MESDLTSQILERFNLLESVLLMTLWKCFHEIRSLYQAHVKEKEYVFRELKREMRQCRFSLIELKTMNLRTGNRRHQSKNENAK